METEEKKPPHKGLKKGLYVIPTAFTAANIAMGFLAVLASLRGFRLVDVSPEQAAVSSARRLSEFLRGALFAGARQAMRWKSAKNTG